MAKVTEHFEGDEIAAGTVVDGRYRIVRPIGQGGAGLVYEVEHTRTGRPLALKVLLDETGFARLEQEARAASLMKNGHTARIIDMEPGGPTGAYMVMELLDGQSLRGLLDEAGQLPLELTVNIALQVCECLDEAHALGIIHRDLKPENVFLCPSPWPGQYDVKVLDFGVMKIAGEGGAIPKSSLTRTGSTVGTPYYMSLEQLRNSSAVDARADVYSLGVVLYECLSGRKPFQAETIGDLVYALCSGPPTPLGRLRPDLPPDLAEIVMSTLSVNREERPRSMVDLASTLLPHGNPAFALWVKIDGKQPALAGRSQMASRVDTSPPPKANFAPAAPPAAPRPAPSAPRAAAATPQQDAGGAGPQTKLAWPPPPKDSPDDGGRRDTPTEMYVKGVHGASAPEDPSEADTSEVAPAGDRDTPTRAYAMEPPRRAPFLETLKSPVGAGTGPYPGGPPLTESAGEATDPANFDPLGSARAELKRPYGLPPLEQGLVNLPSSSSVKNTIPLGSVFRGMLPPQPAPAPPPSAPQKPNWQASLDRALVSVGRQSEELARRYKALPQNTQIIVIIVAGTVVILFLGFVLFLITH
jgi:serine/threonine protein kinase